MKKDLWGIGGYLFHLEWISNEVLLYSTGNSIQYTMVEDSMRKVCVCVCVCIRMTGSPCCTAEIDTML